MAGHKAKPPAGHAHVWVTHATLHTTAGVPYGFERVTCRDCGEVRQQATKRLHA